MYKLLYQIFIGLYPVAIKIASPFNAKAKSWIAGRQNIFNKLSATIIKDDKIIWMHCASLGEFEQGKPVLEKLRLIKNPKQKILVTFFSPSGYEVKKNDECADYIFYLPMDAKQNAQRFFDIVKPQLILFVKYEYWFYYLHQAKQRQIPLLLVSGIFRKDQSFFKWYGGLYREMLTFFTHFFVQNQQAADLIKQLGFQNNQSISGDTRFDRVINIAEQFTPNPNIAKFVQGNKVLVAGSTWLEDDKELDHYANTHLQYRFIIAPHNIIKDRIDECLHLYKNSVTYSQFLTGNFLPSTNTIIIDNIGMLSSLYYYADVCYVGGAFGADGVHNVLEPAVYGKPVIFGPEYEKYAEARELIEAGGGISIDNALELEAALNQLFDKETDRKLTGENSTNYVYSQAGATQKIINYIQENLLLTS